MHNNEFIPDIARVGPEMTNWKTTNTIGNYCISKVTRVRSHPLYYSMCSKCPSPARMQAANVDTTRKQQAQQRVFHKVV